MTEFALENLFDFEGWCRREFAKPGMLNGVEFAARLGISREQLRAMRRAKQVVWLKAPSGRIRYPDWQIAEGRTLVPGLPEVMAAAVSALDAYTRLNMYDPSWGDDRGFEVMRKGEFEVMRKGEFEVMRKGEFEKVVDVFHAMANGDFA